MSILLVSSSPGAHSLFRDLSVERDWRVVSAHDFSGFVSLLRTRDFSVVVYDNDLPDVTWKDALDVLPAKNGPLLIVTARLADERLWADVLHRGGHDVLVQPFDRTEVSRVIQYALERRERRWKHLPMRPRRERARGTAA